MTLRKVTPDQAHALRDSVEEELARACRSAMRGFLNRVKDATMAAVENASLPNRLVAAAGDEVPTLGAVANWWAEYVDTEIMSAVQAAFSRVLNRWSDEGYDVDSPALEGARDYLSKVRNRLVNGTHFGVTVYQESFDRIRATLAASVAEGWPRDKLASRIAAELSWEKNGPYWRSALAEVDSQIDSILDPLGDPGNPVREHARLNDPRVAELRTQRNEMIRRLDDEYTLWRDRAMLIARTESTGAANYGAYEALVAEGVATKVWLATGGPWTRPTHQTASGQETGLRRPFMVGGAALQFPGDPAGPVAEVANCRCAMVAGDYL